MDKEKTEGKKLLKHPFSGLIESNNQKYKERIDLINRYDPFLFLKENPLKKKSK